MDKNEKSKEELQKELDDEKRATWENFRSLKYDKMTPEQREQWAQQLYEKMIERLANEVISLPFDFWKDYKNESKIKDIEKFIKRVDDLLGHLPAKPTKESWLDKDRGIIPTLKKEWKNHTDPFKDERNLRKLMNDKTKELFNLPENKGKEIEVDIGESIKQAQENIEEKVYKPIREKIGNIEAEIKKRVS